MIVEHVDLRKEEREERERRRKEERRERSRAVEERAPVEGRREHEHLRAEHPTHPISVTFTS